MGIKTYLYTTYLPFIQSTVQHRNTWRSFQDGDDVEHCGTVLNPPLLLFKAITPYGKLVINIKVDLMLQAQPTFLSTTTHPGNDARVETRDNVSLAYLHDYVPRCPDVLGSRVSI